MDYFKKKYIERKRVANNKKFLKTDKTNNYDIYNGHNKVSKTNQVKKLLLVISFISIAFIISISIIMSFDESHSESYKFENDNMSDDLKVSHSNKSNNQSILHSLSEDLITSSINNSYHSSSVDKDASSINSLVLGHQSTISQQTSNNSQFNQSSNNSQTNSQNLTVFMEPEKSKEAIRNTTIYFSSRIPYLIKALSDSNVYYMEKLLDSNTNTRAYIIARNENYASNLNGYFYYLYEEKGSTAMLSPFILNVDILFDEKNRQDVISSKKYLEIKYADVLRQSLTAALGQYYTQDIYNFIITNYQKSFEKRLNSISIGNPVIKMRTKNLEIAFHDSFITYIEFTCIE